MSATITIPHDLEQKIAGRAAAQGKDLEQFALEALERAAEAPSIREALDDQSSQSLAIVEELYGAIKGLDRETLISIAEDKELCGY
jgi:hypothetical protein